MISNDLVTVGNCNVAGVIYDDVNVYSVTGGDSQYQVFLENVTVNGELLPIGICDPAIEEYFNNVAWYQVVDPTLVY